MYQAIRLIIAFVVFCVVGFDARFAFALSLQTPETAPESGYSVPTAETADAEVAVAVSEGLSVDTVVREHQADFDPTGENILTWQHIYMRNKAIMIPVCNYLVFDGNLEEKGVLTNLWFGRGGTYGEQAWTYCVPRQRTAWLVAGTKVFVPVSANVLALQAASASTPTDDIDVPEDLVRTPVVAANAFPSQPPVANADVPAATAAIVAPQPSKGLPEYAAFALLIAAVNLLVFVWYRYRYLKKCRVNDANMAKAEQKWVELDRENVELIAQNRDLTDQRDRARKRVSTLEVLSKRDQGKALVVESRSLAKTADGMHLYHLLHMNFVSYEARQGLTDFLVSKGMEVKAHEGISSLIERALKAAQAADKDLATVHKAVSEEREFARPDDGTEEVRSPEMNIDPSAIVQAPLSQDVESGTRLAGSKRPKLSVQLLPPCASSS